MTSISEQYRFRLNPYIEKLFYKEYSPALLAQMKNFIEHKIGAPIRKVYAYEEEHKYGGYCNTCVYEEYSVDIYFKNSDGRMCRYSYDGDMGEFIRTLLKY